MRKLALTVALATMVVSGGADAGGKFHHGRGSISLALTGTFTNGTFGESAAESRYLETVYGVGVKLVDPS